MLLAGELLLGVHRPASCAVSWLELGVKVDEGLVHSLGTVGDAFDNAMSRRSGGG